MDRTVDVVPGDGVAGQGRDTRGSSADDASVGVHAQTRGQARGGPVRGDGPPGAGGTDRSDGDVFRVNQGAGGVTEGGGGARKHRDIGLDNAVGADREGIDDGTGGGRDIDGIAGDRADPLVETVGKGSCPRHGPGQGCGLARHHRRGRRGERGDDGGRNHGDGCLARTRTRRVRGREGVCGGDRGRDEGIAGSRAHAAHSLVDGGAGGEADGAPVQDPGLPLANGGGGGGEIVDDGNMQEICREGHVPRHIENRKRVAGGGYEPPCAGPVQEAVVGVGNGRHRGGAPPVGHGLAGRASESAARTRHEINNIEVGEVGGDRHVAGDVCDVHRVGGGHYESVSARPVQEGIAAAGEGGYEGGVPPVVHHLGGGGADGPVGSGLE